MFFACPPACVTQPPKICSTSFGSMPARSTSPRWTRPSSCAAWNPDSSPLPSLPRAIGVRSTSMITASRISCLLAHLAEDHGAGGHADPRGHEHVAVLLGLVRRRAADQPHALDHAVHAVDVGLRELTAVRVGGQAPGQAEVPVLHEVLRLAALRETERLELEQH